MNHARAILGLMLVATLFSACEQIEDRPSTKQTEDVTSQQILQEMKKQNELMQQQIATEESLRKEQKAASAKIAAKDLLLKEWARILAQREDERSKQNYESDMKLQAILDPRKSLILPYTSKQEQYYEVILPKLREQLETANQEDLVKKSKELNLPLK